KKKQYRKKYKDGEEPEEEKPEKETPKEETPEGAKWVDARVSDDEAMARWGIQSRNA
ncbi:MAG: hypothetical protein RIS72_1305, partial [Pseudomonadota bacterium]